MCKQTMATEETEDNEIKRTRRTVVYNDYGTDLKVDESDLQIVKQINKDHLAFLKETEDSGSEEEDPLIFEVSKTDPECRIKAFLMPKTGRPLPRSLLQLDSLESLTLYCCEMIKVPRWFPRWLGELPRLKTLFLELAEGQGLPEEITDLSKLELLKVNGEERTYVSIPRSIVNLTNLKELKIEMDDPHDGTGVPTNAVRHILFPKTYGKMTNLKTITLRVDEIPDEIGDVTCLETLELNGRYKSIPKSIGSLKSLKSLDLSNGNFPSLPDEIGDLESLEVLTIRRNARITSIPSSIGNLKNLKSLDLGFTKLFGRLPEEMGNLTNLEFLNLDMVKRYRLPSTIGNLKNLRILYCGQFFLDRNSSDKILTKLVRDFPHLGCIGYSYCRVRNPKRLALIHALMSNRAKTRLGCPNATTTDHQGLSMPRRSVWPLILSKPTLAFARYRGHKGNRHTNYCYCCCEKISEPDAIFRILVNYGGAII
jgi:Leucine-rich repeat (LRR) protein